MKPMAVVFVAMVGSFAAACATPTPHVASRAPEPYIAYPSQNHLPMASSAAFSKIIATLISKTPRLPQRLKTLA